MPAVQLSVIIVNYNVKHFVEQCLHSVLNASRHIDAEIFVVDNNSVDGSVPLIREKFPQVKLIANKVNTGFSVANNQAIREATGKYVLLLNPDTVVQEDTFEKTLAFMEAHPDCGGLGVKMVDGKGNFLPESKRGLPTPSVAFYKIFGLAKVFPKSKRFGQYHLGFLSKEENHEVDVLSGAFMLLRHETLDKIGLLDETFFMYGEDIDLSYRITLGGYKNYYFADTSIIHYKGESTKKSSVNYVLVFYKAMAIFAEKHFSQSNARQFSFLIHLAIYLRAGVAIFARLLQRIALPALDNVIMLAGLYCIISFYEAHFKLVEGFYSREMINIAFPLYSLLWTFFVYLSGGYDRPLRPWKTVRGVLAGTAVILIVYALLPEQYRFSRALILLGTMWASLGLVGVRLLLHLFKVGDYRLDGEKSKRIAIIGKEEEYARVTGLLKETRVNAGFLGFISAGDNGVRNPAYIGHISQLQESIDVYDIHEVIFCAKDISSQEIINYMLTLVSSGVDFKIAPPESLSIIGSNSIDTAGDLYVIDVNSVTRPGNKRKKRLLDLTVSVLALAFSPILVWLQEKKGNFFLNILKVSSGWYTWVGYGKVVRKDLPQIKPSVLSPADISKGDMDDNKRNFLHLNYSKDYRLEKDLLILYKGIRFLGN